MGTCVSKCYPSPSPSDSTSKSAAPAPAKEAASASPTTTISSLSPGSTSKSSSSSSSAPCSSSLPRPRDLVLLPNSSKSREWDVVVLDPRSSSYHCSKLTFVHPPGNGRLATPKHKPKRPRSPPTRPATEQGAEDELTNPVIDMDCFIFL